MRHRQGSIYFAGDTAYEDHFRQVRARFGSVSLAFLPIGAYLPRSMMRCCHMNPAEAVRAQRDLWAHASAPCLAR
ncbi:MAG: MBL fold metallo-hydrolase [Polyangiales bacterium]